MPRSTSVGGDVREGGERCEGIQLTDEQRIDWLRLIRSQNVGPRTFRALLNHFGAARLALDALPSLARRGGAQTSTRICSRADAERELAAARKIGVELIAIGEPGYPPRLRTIEDAPPLLSVRGRREDLAAPAVAMVGSRNASGVGIKFAQHIARGLGEARFVVVSGLARGIDAAAHRASIATGTIAVLAGGQDRVYPPEHKELVEAILPAGAVISEMPIGWEPRGRDFPRRNRLISALSLGVVIVEAAKRSGSLITARMALEQGREVFAVPGSPLDPRAEGTNNLIKQGATPVTELADIVSVLQPIMDDQDAAVREPEAIGSKHDINAEPEADERARIVSLLSPAPMQLDDLVRLSRSSPAVVRMVLLELEIAGRLERHGGGLVSIA